MQKLEQWLRDILTDGIKANLSGLFDQVNTKVAEIAVTVGKTPQSWNPSIYNMIKNISDNVMVPIAAIILAIVIIMVVNSTATHAKTLVTDTTNGNTIKVPNKGKWQKLPKTLEFKRRK